MLKSIREMSEGRLLDLDTFDLCRCEANCHVQLEMFIYLIYIAKRLYLVSFVFLFFYKYTCGINDVSFFEYWEKRDRPLGAFKNYF